MKKRHSFLARAAMMLLLAMFTTMTAWADDVNLTADGSTVSDVTTWTDCTVTVSGTSTITFSNRISISGTVILNIGEGATLTAPNGIQVPSGATLTINESGTGTLTANSSSEEIYGAAIGGSKNVDAGTINIKGGTVNATCTHGKAAAIGGGPDWVFSDGDDVDAGTINISGGTVNATSYGASAAIGGGSTSKSGIINISGGIITATSNGAGAAIGCGQGYDNFPPVITSITISGGTVNAIQTKGNLYYKATAAAIGGTQYGSFGTLTISGGKITATGEYMGIGLGENNPNLLTKTITIGLTNEEDYIEANSYNCNKVIVASTSMPLKQKADGGNVYAPGSEITDLSVINGQKMMVYSGVMHTVTFDSNGGSAVASLLVPDGETAVQPESPVKCGYAFDGWTLNSSAYDFSTAVTGDITLVATWSAVQATSYIGSDGNAVANTDIYIPVYANMTKMNNTDAALWVVTDDVTADQRITVNGNVSLVLTDGKTFTAKKGITVGEGNSLTIYQQENGTGTLFTGTTTDDDYISTAENGYAGIGGEPMVATGTIIIYGGKIYATGGNKENCSAAAIGGGAHHDGGVITINGGTIKARGGLAAASIGGGYLGNGGTITINGGDVTIIGKTFGAGIGGGHQGSSGTIVINGGTIDAHSGVEGAAIGTGDQCSHISNFDKVTINGGNVTARSSSSAADIGAGLQSKCCDVEINGGTVDARYIGEYHYASSYTFSQGAKIAINGGVVNAISIGINKPDCTYTKENMTVSLKWTNVSDRITATYYVGSEALTIDDETPFMVNGSADIYTGTLTDAQISAIAGQTLMGVDVLKDNATNNINALDSKETTIVLADRTLYKDGNWNTLCLPFDVTIADSPLKGDNVVAKVLNAGESSLDSNGKLTLKFTEAPATISAGTPFIVKWDNTGVNLVSPVFAGVTVNNADTSVGFGDGNASFVGTYSPFEITNANKGYILLLTGGGKLGYSNVARTLGSCRAYFNTNGANAAREFVIDFGEETTGIQTIDHSPLTIDHSNGAVYDLQGRKVANGQWSMVNGQLKKGLYIVNGRKFIK